MLLRIFILFVFSVVSAAAQCPSPGQQLIGRWKAETGDQEITFRSNHTFIGRNDSDVRSGEWRAENTVLLAATPGSKQLVTIALFLPSGKTRIYKCTFEVSGDKLTFTTSGAVTKTSHGEQLGEPEVRMASLSYERVR